MAKEGQRYRRISGPLRVERLPDRRRKLLRDFVAVVDDHETTVPKGFETDYSSIPWIGRLVVGWRATDEAGVIHDWLYYSGEVSRRVADELWRVVAESGEGGANRFQGWLAHRALRVGGGIAWRRHRKARPRPPRKLVEIEVHGKSWGSMGAAFDALQREVDAQRTDPEGEP